MAPVYVIASITKNGNWQKPTSTICLIRPLLNQTAAPNIGKLRLIKINYIKLSEFKNHLKSLSNLQFKLPDGTYVPTHFHVTEVGSVTKNFIDCGGVVRNEQTVNFQLWEANDIDHRLQIEKLASIIALSESKLGIEDGEIEVEYQGTTIGKYGLEWNGTDFQLSNKFTACLAPDSCGIPNNQVSFTLKKVLASASPAACTPGGACC